MTAAIIAIDAMGGDHGVKSAIPGAALALQNAPDTQFMFFGDELHCCFWLFAGQT